MGLIVIRKEGKGKKTKNGILDGAEVVRPKREPHERFLLFRGFIEKRNTSSNPNPALIRCEPWDRLPFKA